MELNQESLDKLRAMLNTKFDIIPNDTELRQYGIYIVDFVVKKKSDGDDNDGQKRRAKEN